MEPTEPDDRTGPGAAPGEAVAALVASVGPVDDDARRQAAARQDRLTKPRRSLGRVEDLAGRLAAIAGTCPPPVPEPAAVAVFAADHGVVAQGVTPWPQEVTAQMVANLCAGGAAINVLARRVGATLTVVDVGVVHPVADHPALQRRSVRPGTADLRRGPAMTGAEAAAAVRAGAAVGAELVAGGHRCLLTGEMGIGNTTAAAAVIAALTGRPAVEATGRGTGIDDAMFAAKVAVVDDALRRSGPPSDPLQVLAEVGGLEIGAIAGLCLAGGIHRVPVVVDGVIALSGAAVAAALAPHVTGYLIAGHRSVEPGATVALEHLGLEPVLDLGLRLGEGTGAALALPVLQAAAALLAGMATFDSAGVTDAAEP